MGDEANSGKKNMRFLHAKAIVRGGVVTCLFGNGFSTLPEGPNNGAARAPSILGCVRRPPAYGEATYSRKRSLLAKQDLESMNR